MSRLTPARRKSKNPRVQQALSKNEIAKIFVGSQKDCADLQASLQYSLIVDSGVFLNDMQDIVSIRAEPVDNFLVDGLARNDLHAWTCSIGYTTSAPSTSKSECRADALIRQARVCSQNLFHRLSGGELLKNQFRCDPSPCHRRLAWRPTGKPASSHARQERDILVSQVAKPACLAIRAGDRDALAA
jgi:hypothetical protein